MRGLTSFLPLGLARAHFWLHLLGGTVLLVMLALLMTGRIAETAMFPVAPLAELAVLLVLLAVSALAHAVTLVRAAAQGAICW